MVTPQIRPISARSTVVAQGLTQDHARSFCTMKTETARAFLRVCLTQLVSPPDVGFEALPSKTESNEKKNECVFIGSRALCRTDDPNNYLAGLDPPNVHCV